MISSLPQIPTEWIDFHRHFVVDKINLILSLIYRRFFFQPLTTFAIGFRSELWIIIKSWIIRSTTNFWYYISNEMTMIRKMANESNKWSPMKMESYSGSFAERVHWHELIWFGNARLYFAIPHRYMHNRKPLHNEMKHKTKQRRARSSSAWCLTLSLYLFNIIHYIREIISHKDLYALKRNMKWKQ